MSGRGDGSAIAPVLVVIDTTFLVAGALSTTGSAWLALDLWRQGRFRAIVSPAIQAEYEDRLGASSIGVPRDVAESLLALAEDPALTLRIESAPEGPRNIRSPDPKDNWFLDAIEDAPNVTFLLSFDKKHLLALQTHLGVPILRPCEAVTYYLDYVAPFLLQR